MSAKVVLSVAMGFGQVGLSTDEARAVLNSGGKLIFVGLSGASANAGGEYGISDQEKQDWGETYMHELSAHTVDRLMGNLHTSIEDHDIYHDYNSSSEEWYANNGYSKTNHDENYSPTTYFPGSKADVYVRRLEILLAPQLSPKSVPELQSKSLPAE